MRDSKLLEIIRAFTPEECSEFKLFINSPYFNRGAYSLELPKLYDYILASAPAFEAEKLQKEVVHNLIFPQKQYSENRVDRMMFEVNKLAKDFLLIRLYNRAENGLRQDVHWAAILRSKGLIDRGEKELERLNKQRINLNKSSVEQFLTQYFIAREVHEWRNDYNRVKDDVGLMDLLKHLDQYYYTNRLELINRFLLQQKASALPTPDYIQNVLSSMPPNLNAEPTHPLLLINWKIQVLLQKELPAVADFVELKELLLEHEDKIEAESLMQYYVHLRNLCTLLIDAGNTAFDGILHAIQKDNLARGYFYYDGKISPNACLNIVQHALRSGNIEWAFEFIEAHKFMILGETENFDFYRMNVALCLFAEKKYQESLEMIPFGSSYSFYHLMARRLELKIYYELNSDLLFSKLDAFKMFISRVGRKNLSANLSELLTNFGNFVVQLSQSIPGDKKRAAQLEKRINEKKLVGERIWLLEKARELGQGKKY